MELMSSWDTQVVVNQDSSLSFGTFHGKPTHVLLNSLAIPVYVAAFSILALITHIILVSDFSKRLKGRLFSSYVDDEEPSSSEPGDQPAGISAEIWEHIARHGGWIFFVYKVTRLIGCIILLALSIYTTAASEDHAGSHGMNVLNKWGKKRRRRAPHNHAFTTHEWLQLAMCLTYLYACLLALISVVAKPSWSKVVSKHLNALLLTTTGVYFYRDLFPLATFTRTPMDLYEGRILWAKIVTLIFTSVVFPLLVPRQYVPVDPKNPVKDPNPEQTASLLSLVTYSFLDPIIFLGYRVPHLSQDQLPPLSDYDYSQHLTAESFPHLDPYAGAKKHHLFWRLLRVFRREYMILAAMLVIQVVANFASPIGIKELLRYLETRGKDAIVRPWFWILWLLLGPTIGSIAMQWYIYIATRTLVRAECIITQLVFEHSLRIRVKAETEATAASAPSTGSSTISSPDSASLEDTSSPEGESTAASVSGHRSSLTESSQVDTLPSRDETLQANSSSMKSGSSKKGKTKDSMEAEPESHSSAGNLVGKINNLVTTDLANIVEARDFLMVMLYIPLQVTLCIAFLYVVLGWSAFVGLATILLLLPIPGYVAKLIQDVQVARLKTTDARVQSVTETMNVIRMIKLFGWEKKMNEKIAEKRDKELVWIWKRQMLDLINGTLNFLIPVVTMMVTYSTYVRNFSKKTVIMKQQMNASKVFSSMTVFDLLRDQLHMVFYSINQCIAGKVSLDRVDDFLQNTELLDSFSEKQSMDLFEENHSESDAIGFRDATFAWSSDIQGSLTPSKRTFTLRIDGELFFKRGEINLIVGPTGSGKTSLLMALLGEMHFRPSGPESWYNLPREGGVAYAAQESWVQNETIKENIVFGAPFDEARYKKVLNQCSLEHDLSLFEAGDQTEVGEKGLTLSGGQKARITLARALYSQAKIILLDDVLAALDIHTAKWIIEKCFTGDLIRGRTVLLVTHNIAMTRPIAGFIVHMGVDGTVLSQGSVSEALARDSLLAEEVIEEEEVLNKVESVVDSPAPPDEKTPDGKLILAEEVEEGHVSWGALELYFRGLGGNHPILFFLTFTVGLLFTDLSGATQTWYLGYWASQYDDHDASEVKVAYYLSVYGALLFSGVLVYFLSYVMYLYGSIRASKSLHKQLVESVMGTTLRWLDVTPTSRVIARCTQDIRAVDGPIPTGFWVLTEMTVTLLVKLGAVVLMTPAFLIPGILVAVVGGWCGQVYIAAQLSVKREMSNAKAPVLGHFGAAIAGLTSIRAYGTQKAFQNESLNRINRYTRAARTFYNLNRWICIRIDAIGALFAASLAASLIYLQDHTAANTGFSLNMAVGFSGMILWWVRVLNDFEVQGNSLERIQGYVKIEQETKSTEQGAPPAYWPASGDIRVDNLSARYSLDGPEVLHDLSFHIKSGERIGVVGRTGSGKSSLTLSLLRCIFTEGNVYYDGLDTKSINLDALRSNITIIPQIPELLSGSLRQNLDPFDQHDDATLNDALRAAGLFSLQSEMDEERITLDSAISSGGGNLSVGQRQILALARAIVRGSKLLILDEATSAIDYKTDSVIQSSLRHELRGGVTLITVAHRLQTIMDADKIMVLDAGSIAEFDSPKELLKLPDGKLRALVDESGNRNALYAVAEGSSEI